MNPAQLRNNRHAPPPPRVGESFAGKVSNIVEYGAFIRFGPYSGLLHRSACPEDIPLSALGVGDHVRVAVTRIRHDGKVALSLLKHGAINHADMDRNRLDPEGHGRTTPTLTGADDLGSRTRAYDSATNFGNAFLNAVSNVESGKYNRDVGNAVREGVDLINRVGDAKRNLDVPQRAGFVAEASHTSSYNTDVAFKGGDTKAVMLESINPKSPDIKVVGKNGEVLQEVSSKVYKNAKGTAEAQRPYCSQKRLVPSDQLEDAKKYAGQRAQVEATKSGPGRAKVVAEYKEVNKLATDRIKTDKASSKPMSREDTLKMAEKAKGKAVNGADIVGDLKGRMADGAKAGGKAGVLTGAAINAATGTYIAIRDYRRGTKTGKTALKDIAVKTGKGAMEGGIKGAAAGAASAGGRVLAERTTSTLGKRILGGNAPATVAITTVEIAKHAIDFARGKSTAAEFRAASAKSAVNGATSYIGAEIGFMLGGPIGAVVGGIAAPMLTLAAEETGLASRIRRMFADNTDTGHSSATIFHMEQRNRLLDALRDSSAVLFLDRVLETESGHHATCELILVHESKVYMIDFRAWKGKLSYPEKYDERIINKKVLFIFDTEEKVSEPTGEYDQDKVLQYKVDDYGYGHKKLNRNPIKGISFFVHRSKRYLVGVNARWKRITLEPRIVFPDDAVELDGELANDPRFMKFNELLTLLRDTKAKPTPKWMLDDLSLLPMWDVIEGRNGSIYEGLIATESITVKVEKEELIIPVDAILKVEVKLAESFSRADEVEVTLRSLVVIKGFVEHVAISMVRKGHTRVFNLCDIKAFCPAHSAFA